MFEEEDYVWEEEFEDDEEVEQVVAMGFEDDELLDNDEFQSDFFLFIFTDKRDMIQVVGRYLDENDDSWYYRVICVSKKVPFESFPYYWGDDTDTEYCNRQRDKLFENDYSMMIECDDINSELVNGLGYDGIVFGRKRRKIMWKKSDGIIFVWK